MWLPDTGALSRRLTEIFGLDIEAVAKQSVGDWPALELRPAGIPREISFTVDVALGWRSIALILVPGAFAGPLVASMGEAGSEERGTFAQLALLCARSRGAVTLEVNGAPVDVVGGDNWPDAWRRMSLRLVKSPAVVNTEDYPANDAELLLWTRHFLSLALALMPLEEFEPDAVINPDGLPEGAKVRIEANRYERSRINRAACIELQGDSCLVCDFNFGETFGDHGEGFIHVHHVVPVSQIGAGYRVSPVTDLVPLCPNCHAMSHQFDPPATVAELRALRRQKA
jgi:5-methylcytosine-specific restriction protein A